MATNSNEWTGLTLSDGRYSVTAKLGEGGMGLVYRARDTRLGMDVVIKAPRQAMLDDPEFSGRFAREIRSLVKLSHPCIVKVTDVGQHGSLPFAVMQYLSGGSLEDRLLPPGGQPVAADPKTVPGWLQGVASALDYVHAQGYVHRDVKPGNILFDSQGYSFLGDFGVIKALAATEATRSRTQTGAGLVLGTPEYMAPELIMGGKVDGRADQYALAVTVYEALCGRRPFEGASSTAVLVLHTMRPPAPLTEVRPDLPDRLSQAVLKGLAKDSSQRYPNCAALAAAVVAALEGSPAFAPGAGSSAPNPASSESVKVLCPSCGKKISMVLATYSNLKRTRKSVPCPNCQEPIQVASERTQILSAPPLDPGSSRSGTQKLPAMSPAGTAERVSTEKIYIPNLVTAEETPLAPKDRVKTQVIGRAQTQLLPQGQDLNPGQAEEPPVARPSWLPWIGMGATTVLLVAVLAYAISLRGSQSAPAQVQAQVTPTPAPAPHPVREVPPSPEEKPRTAESVALNTPAPAVPAPDNDPPAQPPRPSSPSAESGNVGPFAPTTTREEVPAPASPAGAGAETAMVDAGTVATEPASLTASKPDTTPPGRAEPSKTAARSKSEGDHDEVALTDILAAPDKYGDQEISPKGVFRTARLVTYPRNSDSPTIGVMESAMSIKQLAPGNFLVAPTDGGKITNLQIEPQIADRLVAHQVLYRDAPINANKAGWLPRVAKLTVRMLQATGMSRGSPWICRIVKIEFLIGLNAPRIGEHKYAKAFGTYTVTPDAEGTGIANGDEWQKRLGSHFIVNFGKAAKFLKTQQSIQRSAAANLAVANAVNRSIAASSAANAAGEAARHGALTPGPLPNAHSLFQAEINLNAELGR